MLAATNCELDIDGFAFDGLRRGGEILRFTGVLYVSASGTVRNCSFTGFRPAANPLPFNPAPERAVQMVNNGAGIVHVAVRDCHFTDNVDSIFISGPAGVDPNAHSLDCEIADNVIVGLGPQPFNPQTGIKLSAGARGLIRGNHVSGHTYLGPTTFRSRSRPGSWGSGPSSSCSA